MKKMITELEYIRKAYKFAMERIEDLEEENKKLKEERDFFKEQAILWRKDYKNEYEKNRMLGERIEELKTDYDRLKRAFNDVLYDKK